MSHKAIEEVKSEWERRLTDIPGVMGVGIGLTKDRKQKCIKVFMNREASPEAERIPKEIEGFPLEVEIRKPFKTLQ
jgi:hypothetical protein